MNKYLVIGNPIEHSLSPLLHNFWFKKHGLLNFIYDKKKIEKNELKKIVEQIQKDEIKGVNITVPFKRDIFNYIDLASEVAQSTNSINTLVKENNKIIGHNTDQEGFKLSLKDINWNFKNKKIFIIGAGGVTSSILSSFINIHGVDKIYLCNRTRSKAEDLKNFWDKKIDDSKMNKNTIEIVYGLRNFIGNANKFASKTVFLNLKSNSEITEITIEDDGYGYPKDILSKIGEPYLKSNNSSSESKKGLGLGLFIGKTLLEKNFAIVDCRNSKTRSGAEVIIKWFNKDLFNI